MYDYQGEAEETRTETERKGASLMEWNTKKGQ